MPARQGCIEEIRIPGIRQIQRGNVKGRSSVLIADGETHQGYNVSRGLLEVV